MLHATIVTNAFSAKAIHLSKRIIVNITLYLPAFYIGVSVMPTVLLAMSISIVVSEL